MKALFYPVIISLFLLFYILGSQLVASNIATRMGGEVLSLWAWSIPLISNDNTLYLIKQTNARIDRYEDLLKKAHLAKGMVINRSLSNREEKDLCDSLLFSSIRYASLTRLGRSDDALDAWYFIEQSKLNGMWIRHPKCSRKSLSRDMLTGVLLALLHSPPRAREHLENLVNELDKKSGYFSHGPVYVSYLTPGLGKIIRLLSHYYDLDGENLPEIIKQGYSTNEFSVILIEPGYEAHLAALALWIEMEIDTKLKIRERNGYLDHLFNALIRPFSKGDLKSQSFSWTSKRLFEIDPKNLFFTFLRLKTAGAMNAPIAALLLQRLLNMEEFPEYQLPADCDRRADYLWQRSSTEYKSRSKRCDHQFSGIDFTWMASLLLSELDTESTISWSK